MAPLLTAVFSFDGDVLSLPTRVDAAATARWHVEHLGMKVVSEELRGPGARRVVVERDGQRIGFEESQRDPEQNGAAFHVSDAAGLRDELVARGVQVSNWRVDERDGKSYQVFFAKEPGGLCYYFMQLLQE